MPLVIERDNKFTPHKRENRWIRRRRLDCNMNLRQLAAEARMTMVRLGELERGVRLPGAAERAAILRALHQEELNQIQSQFA